MLEAAADKAVLHGGTVEGPVVDHPRLGDTTAAWTGRGRDTRQLRRQRYVRTPDAQAGRTRYLRVTAEERRGDQLHFASRPRPARLDGERRDRHRTQELDGQARHEHGLAALKTFDR